MSIFICLEITLFFVTKVEDSVHMDGRSYVYVRGTDMGDPCWMYDTTSLLGRWERDGDRWKPPGFTVGPTYKEFPRGNGSVFIPGTTLVVRRWDPFNPYEMMHAMFNYYVITRHLRLDRPVVIFNDRWAGTETKDMVMWKALSRHILTDDMEEYQFEKAVYLDNPSKCLINSPGSCPVALYDEFAMDVATSFNGIYRVYDYPKIRVLWSSRFPYWRNGSMRRVHRMVDNEGKFLGELGAALGDRYQVFSHDFGNFTHDESVRAAVQGDVMVGVHGAGLQWSTWLPPGAPLVEIFGGDRGPSNVHYKTIARAQDRPYKSCNWGTRMKWKLDCVVSAIKSFNFRP